MNEIWKLEVQHLKKHEQSNSQTGCDESTAPTSAASILTVVFVICFLLYQCFVHFSLLCSVAATQHSIRSFSAHTNMKGLGTLQGPGTSSSCREHTPCSKAQSLLQQPSPMLHVIPSDKYRPCQSSAVTIDKKMHKQPKITLNTSLLNYLN